MFKRGSAIILLATPKAFGDDTDGREGEGERWSNGEGGWQPRMTRISRMEEGLFFLSCIRDIRVIRGQKAFERSPDVRDAKGIPGMLNC